MEDKQKMCDALLPVLQMTRNFNGLVNLKYEDRGELEVVTAEFSNGYTKKANVTADSGSAMLLDIILQLR